MSIVLWLSGHANAACEAALALLVAVFTGLVIIAVTSRYVFDLSIVTSVELTRIAFVWACFLGASVGVARGAHIRVAFIADAMPPGLRRALAVFAALTTLGFGLAMVWYGWALTERMRPTFLPTLQWSQAVLYAALPVSGALIVLHAAAHALRAAYGGDGDPS